MNIPERIVRTYPRSRLATFDVGRIGGRKHHVAAMLEVDVTEARGKIREIIRSGGKASLIAWTVHVAGQAVRRHPEMAALNHRSCRQVVFSDVDIAVPLERTVNGVRVPLTTIVRAADTKTVAEILEELGKASKKTVEGPKDYVLAERKRRRVEDVFFYMPGFLRRIIWRLLMRSPDSVKRNMGTVMITNIGLAGRTSGWILPKTLHNLSIAVGSIGKKPRAVKDSVVIRDVMNLTILFDHDIADGAPAARFTDTLVRLMEDASGLS